MDINIKTRYDIGDTVYIAECYNGEFVPSKACIVKDIKIWSIGINEPRRIIYKVLNNDFEETIDEPVCFESYAKCLEWCDLHNRKL